MKYIYIFYSINEDSHACVFKETHFTLIGNTSLNKLHIKKMCMGKLQKYE